MSGIRNEFNSDWNAASSFLHHEVQTVEDEFHSKWNQAQAPAQILGPALSPGTVIATFNDAGHFYGHAAIFESIDGNAIHVIDQWIFGTPKSVGRHQINFGGGCHSSSPRRTFVGDGDNYYVVE
ncbi:MAG: BPSL0067 family protein [Terracidiphilus sp.]|jgi:hypothetical protein